VPDPAAQPSYAQIPISGACIEESNCNWELATVCAFSNASASDQVNFLGCMDESSALDALHAATKCAASSSIDANSIKSCYNGPEGQALLGVASKAWNKAFPSRATVPHTFVNSDTVQADYNDLKKALCKAGSTASVCKSALTESTKCFI